MFAFVPGLYLSIALAPLSAIQGYALERGILGPSTPFAFLENRGQVPGEAAFVGQLPGVVVRAERSALALQVESQGQPDGGVLVRLEFEGARSCAVPVGEQALAGIHNFFQGKDPSHWYTGIRRFARVRYRDLYPGIDLVLREEGGALEYDVILAPGADLSRLVVRCLGVDGIEQSADGPLLLHTPKGPLLQTLGHSWEVLPDGERREIAVGWRLLDGNRFGFEAPGHDPALALVVDPGLVWSTYIGGSDGGSGGDIAYAVTYGASGDVFVTGKAEGLSFPMTPGTYQNPGPLTDTNDVFVARFRGHDGALIYSSKIGGAHHIEQGQAVATDSSGRATVAGHTFSVDFPTTPNAFDTVKDAPNWSAFVLRLSPLGDQLEYSTFLEGPASGARAFALGIAASGSAIVGGITGWDYPVTPGAFSTTPKVNSENGFLTRLDPSGSSLEWSTYLGAGVRVYASIIGESDVVTLTGAAGNTLPTTGGVLQSTHKGFGDAYALRMNSTGSAVVWATYLGGKGEDTATAIALTPSGGVVVTGITYSLDFPTTPGAFQRRFNLGIIGSYYDSFVSRLDPLAQKLEFSTYLGSNGNDVASGVAVDRSGVVTVAGWAQSAKFPTTPGSYATTSPFGNPDLFVTRMDPTGSKLLYSTYVGGPKTDWGTGMAMNPLGRITLVGGSNGAYPTTPGAFSPFYNGGQTDGVVTTLDLLLEGVQLFGSSTPACLGPIQLNATRMPAASDKSFGFYCSGAPPTSQGWLLVGQASATPTILGGAGVWLDLGKPFIQFPVTTNSEGYAEISFPLDAAQVGDRFSCQGFFPTTPTCSGTGAWSASQPVTITVMGR